MGMFNINRASTGPLPNASPTRPPSSDSSPSSSNKNDLDNDNNRKSWLSKFRPREPRTFPRESKTFPQTSLPPQTTTPSSRDPSPPAKIYSWLTRTSTLNSPDSGASSLIDINPTPAELYASAPKWRRDAAKKRVRDLRAWLACEADPPEPFFLTVEEGEREKSGS